MQKKEIKNYYPIPKKFDIVVGQYPDSNKINEKNINEDNLVPFGKKRFMLVLGVIRKHHRVIVIYLTSLKEKHVKFGISSYNQYVIEDPVEEEVGLCKDTLMTFSRYDISSLKYTSRYFKEQYNEKEKRKTPVVGRLSNEDIFEVEKFLLSPEIAIIIKDLENNPTVPMILS